jgi:23S rRNA-/tRNA-specific pseudouridylate synthase
MLQRQKDMLKNTLERLTYEATVKLSKRQLKHALSAQRLAKNSWGKLFELLPQEIKTKDLYIIEEDDDIIIIRKSALQDAGEY